MLLQVMTNSLTIRPEQDGARWQGVVEWLNGLQAHECAMIESAGCAVD
jgi:hypothetical protein